MIKRFMAGIMVLALVMAGFMLAPERACAAGESAVYYDTAGDYDIADYWSESVKKAPVKDGYVFGGWFTGDAADPVPLKEEDLSDAAIGSLDAFAKFVPADVLTVKTQVASEDGKAHLRLLSTTDCIDYQKVGFEYQLGSRDAAVKEMTKVYSAIRPSKTSSEILLPGETFSAVSKYFIALDVININASSFSSIVYARAFWVTADGTRVMGLSRNNRVEDSQNSYISVGVNLMSDVVTYLPVAAAKVVVTYNTTDYDVVTESEGFKIDKGRVFAGPDLDYAVDETAGTVTFVGNAPTVDENVLADGLLANIRFVKTTSANNALNLAIGSSEFVNWAEETVSGISVR